MSSLCGTEVTSSTEEERGYRAEKVVHLIPMMGRLGWHCGDNVLLNVILQFHIPHNVSLPFISSKSTVFWLVLNTRTLTQHATAM